jgi:hypothetical protein
MEMTEPIKQGGERKHGNSVNGDPGGDGVVRVCVRMDATLFLPRIL